MLQDLLQDFQWPMLTTKEVSGYYESDLVNPTELLMPIWKQCLIYPIQLINPQHFYDILETHSHMLMTQLVSSSVFAATGMTSLLILRRLSYMPVLKKETGMPHASSGWVTQMIPQMPSTSIALKSVVASSSPFILNATLNKHLNQYNDPVGKDVRKNIYVEDLISGVQHEEEAATYYNRARTLMSPVDFNLTSWTSNNPVIQSLAAKEYLLCDRPETKVLGV